jgi:hypothetical protein
MQFVSIVKFYSQISIRCFITSYGLVRHRHAEKSLSMFCKNSCRLRKQGIKPGALNCQAGGAATTTAFRQEQSLLMGYNKALKYTDAILELFDRAK